MFQVSAHRLATPAGLRAVDFCSRLAGGARDNGGYCIARLKIESPCVFLDLFVRARGEAATMWADDDEAS